ncbi:MAG: hypothetical protein HY298_24865 [Verrucomicrobia bacterium]|nr:hypothetical protein [Verrucomicrobiota bacterium]
MRRFFTILALVSLYGLLGDFARAETYQLKDGQTMTGEFVSSDESGVVIKLGDNKYSDRIPWSKFSQSDLKEISKKNAKAAQFVEPFIELTQDEKIQRKAITINEVPRLERPVAGSLIGALFSSGIGLFILFVLYLGNLYAAFEISNYRARPVALVCGVSAVAPVIGPIIFLSLPMQLKPSGELTQAEEEALLPEAPPEEYAETASGAPVADTGGLHIARSGTHPAPSQDGNAPASAPAASLPPTVVYERGQFIFNRRFFETKFSGFFGVVPRGAEKDMVVVIKSSRGEFTGQRISRIAANEMHFQVDKGQASEEVMIPFIEIKQVQLKHKDA